jgi:hypothetical protein
MERISHSALLVIRLLEFGAKNAPSYRALDQSLQVGRITFTSEFDLKCAAARRISIAVNGHFAFPTGSGATHVPSRV